MPSRNEIVSMTEARFSRVFKEDLYKVKVERLVLRGSWRGIIRGCVRSRRDNTTYTFGLDFIDYGESSLDTQQTGEFLIRIEEVVKEIIFSFYSPGVQVNWCRRE